MKTTYTLFATEMKEAAVRCMATQGTEAFFCEKFFFSLSVPRCEYACLDGCVCFAAYVMLVARYITHAQHDSCKYTHTNVRAYRK